MLQRKTFLITFSHETIYFIYNVNSTYYLTEPITYSNVFNFITRISSKKNKHLATQDIRNTGKLSEVKIFDPSEAATKRKVTGSLESFQAVFSQQRSNRYLHKEQRTIKHIPTVTLALSRRLPKRT